MSESTVVMEHILPKWVGKVRELYKNSICNAFILTGNINDYVYQNIGFKEFLTSGFGKCIDFNYDELVIFDPASNGTVIKTSSGNESSSKISFETFLKEMVEETKRVFVINYPQYMLNDNNIGFVVSLHKMINSFEFFGGYNILFIVADTASSLPSIFTAGDCKTYVIDEDLPSYERRLAMVNYLMNDTRFNNVSCDVSNEALANLCAGLTLVNIEDLFLKCNQDTGFHLSTQSIIKMKEALISKQYGEILELMDTSNLTLDDYAGMDNIKKYFREVVITGILNNDVEMVPKGILFMGPPGTGKTYLAKCLAGSAKMNFVELKVSKIKNKYVGESEKSMAKALAACRAMAPVGIFIDELDQNFSRGEGDANGINQALFGMLLTEMSKPENRGKLIWIAASNYPNHIDEALKRAGRFDKKIPFFAPDEEDRIRLFENQVKKSARSSGWKFSTTAEDYADFAKTTDGYTQAEIESVLVKTIELCKRNKQQAITAESIKTALDYIIPADNSRIAEMERVAIEECNDLEFVPEKYKSIIRGKSRGSGTEPFIRMTRG